MKNKVKGGLPVGYRLHGESFTYEIEKSLGQGSFGITYLAHIVFEGRLGSLKNIKQQVAIKEFYMRDINSREESFILNGSHAETFQNYHRRFRKEAENLSKMDHPGIVNVMEIFEANGTSYYVMDFLSGGTFDEYIRERVKLPVKEALQYILKIGDALAYMHAHRMLHLDLKPANIGMTETNEPVLIDFGLSKVFDENGQPESTTGIGGGTSGYSPLEQMNYNPEKGLAPTLDIHAFGGTLFKALTGMTPPDASRRLDAYDDDNNIDILLTECMAEHNISENVMELVTWAMSLKKKKRPQTVESFAERAKCILEDLSRDEENTECKEGIDFFDTEEQISNDILSNYEDYDGNGYEGLVAVKKNGLWGYLDSTGREVIPCIYHTANTFVEGLARVSKNQLYGHIDATGREIIPVVHPSLGAFGAFDDEIIEAAIGNKRGYYNHKGEIVIPFVYEKALPFSEGLAPVCKNGKWGFVTSGNRVAIPFIYDEVWSFTEGRAMAKLNDKWGFIDKDSRIIAPFEYDEVEMFNGGEAKVMKNGKWGCINLAGNVIVPIVYDNRDSLYTVEREEDDEYLYMNAKGNDITGPSFERSCISVHHVEDIHGFRCRVRRKLETKTLLTYLLSDMSHHILSGSLVHYHQNSYQLLYSIYEGDYVTMYANTTDLPHWIKLLDNLRTITGLPFRFGTPDEVLEYSREKGDITMPYFMDENMFALDMSTGKFCMIDILTKVISSFDLNDEPQARILLVCDVMRTPLEGTYGFDKIQSFGYAYFKRPNGEGCDILDNQMNVLIESRHFDYNVVSHEEYRRFDNPPKFGVPRYRNGEPYIGNIFYILEDERKSSKWPASYHIGPNMELVPGMMVVNEETEPYEK